MQIETIRAPRAAAERSASSAGSGGGSKTSRYPGTITVSARPIASSPARSPIEKPVVVETDPASTAQAVNS